MIYDIRHNGQHQVRFQRTKLPIARFLAKIEVIDLGFDSPCWKWTAATDAAGYGRIKVEGENFAHRVSYRLFVGDIPAGYHVDHLCRYRGCVNPLHLEAVLQRENWNRRDEARTHCKHGHALTPENVSIYKNTRVCKTCRYRRIKEWRDRNPAAAKAIGTASKQGWRESQREAGRTGRY